MSREILISERLQAKKDRRLIGSYDPFGEEETSYVSLSFVDRRLAKENREKAEEKFSKSLKELYDKLW